MKYKFEIKYNNDNGGRSTEYFSCSASTKQEAMSQVEDFIMIEHLLHEKVEIKELN